MKYDNRQYRYLYSLVVVPLPLLRQVSLTVLKLFRQGWPELKNHLPLPPKCGD